MCYRRVWVGPAHTGDLNLHLLGCIMEPASKGVQKIHGLAMYIYGMQLLSQNLGSSPRRASAVKQINTKKMDGALFYFWQLRFFCFNCAKVSK